VTIVLVLSIWGLNGVVLKVALLHVRPISLVTVRMLIAGLFMATVAALGRRQVLPPPDLRVLVPAALCGIVLNQIAFTYGLHLSTVVDIQLIIGLGPVLTVLVFSLYSRRLPQLRQVVALALGFGGVLLVVLASGRGQGGSLVGDLIGLATPATWAVYLVIASEAGKRFHASYFTIWTLLAGFVILAPLTLVQGGGRDDWLPALPALAYASFIATGLGYALFFWAIPRLGVTASAIYMYLQPPIGALAGVIFLHELLGPAQVAGAIAIVAAAYLGARGSRPARDRKESAR
jgi:drug/metabolite transporter (DMT)-like permease